MMDDRFLPLGKNRPSFLLEEREMENGVPDGKKKYTFFSLFGVVELCGFSR